MTRSEGRADGPPGTEHFWTERTPTLVGRRGELFGAGRPEAAGERPDDGEEPPRASGMPGPPLPWEVPEPLPDLTPQDSEPARTWSVDEHRDDVVRRLHALEPIEMPLLEAHGCVLAEDLDVPVAQPPCDVSAVDGYAVRVTDLQESTPEFPAVLTVARTGVAPGECVRVAAGERLPEGAEAVVPGAWTEATAARDELSVRHPVTAGGYVRRRGSALAEGAPALRAGTPLGPAQLGVAATVGHDRVTVRPRPRLVVVSAGDELTEPGQELRPGRVYDSVSATLTAAARAAGAVAHPVRGIPADAETLRAVVAEQLGRADIVVLCAGDADLGTVLRAATGAARGHGTVECRTVGMLPGRTHGFGLLGAPHEPDRTAFFALPGHPMSAYIAFEVFVRPAVRALLGLRPPARPTLLARCATDLRSPRGKRHYRPAVHTPGGPYDALGTVVPLDASGAVLEAGRVNALLVVPEDVTLVPAGTDVDVLPLG
ncbi:gephyrin-like molybdotransferase Glp [Streptomyces sp. NPDC090106]|uniref:molybdopterin molybdotransferase MoeA n=1 Tax=Streptomyces sp. NPDC090106 TaxID=3365946 RepID=UPI00382BAA00